uniref:APH domain-containing protein n=1 Tax=Steinernema glaseri TaxID=37863 RepID=A0A1I7Y9Q6_9BILA
MYTKELKLAYDVANILAFNYSLQFKLNRNRLPHVCFHKISLFASILLDHTFGIAREHLGFLGESGAHTRLISMYEEIFRPGLIDETYMDKTPRDGDFASLLANYLSELKKVHSPFLLWLEL